MIFDTHAHYDDEAFDEDRDQLLSSMKDGGVGCIVNVCASAGGFGGTLELIKAYPFVYGAVGVHPDDAGIMTQDTLDEIRRLSHLKKMVAIGEIGLDYYWHKEEAEHKQQQEMFRAQMDIAREEAAIYDPQPGCSRGHSGDCKGIYEKRYVRRNHSLLFLQ